MKTFTNEIRVCTVYTVSWDGSDDLYVGSTTQLLKEREKRHHNQLRAGKQWPLYKRMRLATWEDAIFTTIHQCIVADYKHQLRVEQRFMDQLKPNVNHARAFNTPEITKIKKAEYYQANKEHLRTKNKEWYKNNKERHDYTRQRWHNANLDKVKAYQKEYREAHADEHKAYKAAWYQANKAKQSTASKTRYQANKTAILARQKVKVTCECGKTMSKGSLTRHKKTCKGAGTCDKPKSTCECGKTMLAKSLSRHKKKSCPLRSAPP